MLNGMNRLGACARSASAVKQQPVRTLASGVLLAAMVFSVGLASCRRQAEPSEFTVTPQAQIQTPHFALCIEGIGGWPPVDDSEMRREESILGLDKWGSAWRDRVELLRSNRDTIRGAFSIASKEGHTPLDCRDLHILGNTCALLAYNSLGSNAVNDACYWLEFGKAVADTLSNPKDLLYTCVSLDVERALICALNPLRQSDHHIPPAVTSVLQNRSLDALRDTVSKSVDTAITQCIRLTNKRSMKRKEREQYGQVRSALEECHEALSGSDMNREKLLTLARLLDDYFDMEFSIVLAGRWARLLVCAAEIEDQRSEVRASLARGSHK